MTESGSNLGDELQHNIPSILTESHEPAQVQLFDDVVRDDTAVDSSLHSNTDEHGFGVVHADSGAMTFTRSEEPSSVSQNNSSFMAEPLMQSNSVNTTVNSSNSTTFFDTNTSTTTTSTTASTALDPTSTPAADTTSIIMATSTALTGTTSTTDLTSTTNPTVSSRSTTADIPNAADTSTVDQSTIDTSTIATMNTSTTLLTSSTNVARNANIAEAGGISSHDKHDEASLITLPKAVDKGFSSLSCTSQSASTNEIAGNQSQTTRSIGRSGSARSKSANEYSEPMIIRTNASEDAKNVLSASKFPKSASAMLIASTTILSEVTSSTSFERKMSRSETFAEGTAIATRIALSLDSRRPPANAPALQSVLTAIENDTRQCAAELIKVLNNTRDHVKNATTISLDYMRTMNQNAQNVHSAVDVAVDQASSFIHQVAELEKELSCLDEFQANLNLTKEYLTSLEQYVQSL